MFSGVIRDAIAWAKGRRWPLRLLLLVYLFYAGLAKLSDPNAWELFSGISLGIHELGHVLFGFGPEFLMFMGGTLLELAAPIGIAIAFYYQRDYFAIIVATTWLALSLFGVSDYQQDASRMLIPLVGLTGDPQHDWNNIFSVLGVLGYDSQIAWVTNATAVLIWAGSMLAGLWLLLNMVGTKEDKKSPRSG